MIVNILLIFNFIALFVGGHELIPAFGYGMTPWDISAILIILYSFKRLFWNGDRPKISRNHIYTGLVIFLASVLISIFVPIFSGNRLFLLQVIKTTVHLIFFITYFFSFIFLDINKEKIRVLFKALLIVAFITNVFAVYQLFARIYDLPLKLITFYNSANVSRGKMEDNEIAQLTLQFENFTRATSYMSEPSALAGANCFFLLLTLVPYLTKQKQYFKSKVFNSLNLIFMLLGLFLTFSLSGLLGLSLILSIAVFVHRRLSFSNLFKGLGVALLIIILADVVAEKTFDISVLGLFGQRISSILPIKNNKTEQIAGESLEHRQTTFERSYKIWKENPIIGIGIGLTSYHKEFDLAFSDTSIMAMMGEAGIIGGISMTLMFAFIFYYSYNIMKDKKLYDSEDGDIAILSAIVLYLFTIIFNSNYLVSNQIINTGYWHFFALIVAIINMCDNYRNKDIIEIKLISEGLSTKLAKGLNNMKLSGK
jgi:O-antigen ligase